MHLLTDDYNLAILPLAGLMAEKPEIRQYCARMGGDRAAYRKVLRSGTLGYQLYTYHNLVQTRLGEQVAQKVRERQLGMLSHISAFDTMLAIIDDAVAIGTVSTSTSRGEIVTPVEMTVALALLLGLPESAHYVTSPEQRNEQITQLPADIEWCFADLLASGRREMVRTFQLLAGLLNIPESSVPGSTRSSTGG